MTKALAEDSGWLTNCDTVDDMVKSVLKKYPLLKGAGAALSELRRSFNLGRRVAEKERLKPLPPVRTLEQMRVPVAVEVSKIVRENFAGFEEVPLDETDLDCEPEVVREHWDLPRRE